MFLNIKEYSKVSSTSGKRDAAVNTDTQSHPPTTATTATTATGNTASVTATAATAAVASAAAVTVDPLGFLEKLEADGKCQS